MRGKFNKHIAFILAILMTALFIPTTAYAADVADDIKYSVSSGAEVEFDEDDFNKECDDILSTLDYVKFDLPSSSRGVLWYDYGGSKEEKVSASVKYKYDESTNSLDKVSFIADDEYSGTVTIGYYGWDDNGDDYTGDIVITVKEGAKVISYSVDSDETITFNDRDFNDACQDLNDKDLDYVKFTLPSSSKGVLYYKYDDGDYDSKVTSTTAYKYDASPSIDDVTFVPDDEYSGTVLISYKAYDEDDDLYNGTVKITVGGSASGDITYKVDAGEKVDFEEDDFNDYCQDENDADLDYVKFDVPSSSKGILYYDYKGSGQEKVEDTDKYYYDKSSDSIDDLTFVADDDYSGSFTIDFEGEDEDGDSIKGTVAIKVAGEDKTAGDIFLSGVAGSPVTMFDEYFNKKCKDTLDNDLDYVKFTLPTSTTGTLYYNYNANSALTKVTGSTKYYYEDDSPYLSKVAFITASTSAGTAIIKYTGYDVDGASFTGQVKITLTAGTGTTTGLIKSTYFKDVDEAYSWAVKYVDTLYSTGVITGASTDNNMKLFYPSYKITRGDFMLLLVRALNLQSSAASTNFSDVAKGSYYYDAIATAKALGIAKGTENKFYPDSSITREDAMVLALRAMNISGSGVAAADASTLTTYSDNYVISDYAKEAIATLIKAGVITGSDDGKIHPMESITRVQAAAIIYRIKY